MSREKGTAVDSSNLLHRGSIRPEMTVSFLKKEWHISPHMR
jgi:hypothetical protein